MEKLTNENIAPYVPYGLMTDKGKLNGIMDSCIAECRKGMLVTKYHVEQVKPILRSMDLTKPIIVEGKEIIPIVEISLYKHLTIKHIIDGRKKYSVIFDVAGSDLEYSIYKDGSTLTLREAQWLFKHKFDVFGLIEKGLAIDVNTLTANPYE